MNLSIAFHTKKDGQTEHTIKTLEYMLRDCVINSKRCWNSHITLIEFAYNDNCHSSIQMVPYDALYMRRCISPIRWSDFHEEGLIGTDLVHQSMEKVKVIQKRLNMAQSSKVLQIC